MRDGYYIQPEGQTYVVYLRHMGHVTEASRFTWNECGGRTGAIGKALKLCENLNALNSRTQAMLNKAMEREPIP